MAVVRGEFRSSLNLSEGSFRRPKLVLDYNRQFHESQTVTGKNLIVNIGSRQNDFANLDVHAENKVVRIEFRPTENGILAGMIPRVRGETDFPSRDNGGAPALRIRLEHGDLTINSEFQAVDGRKRIKSVCGVAYVNSKSPSLTIGWDHGQENQTNAHEQRFAALHPCVSSGK